MKTSILTGALVGALIAAPITIQADPPKPKWIEVAIDICVDVSNFCILLGVTCIMVNNGIGDWVNRNLWGNGQPPPPPPEPPEDPGGEGAPDTGTDSMPHLKTSSITAVDLSSSGFADNNQPGQVGVFTNCTMFLVQSTTNLTSWTNRQVLVWKSTIGSLLLVGDDAGNPLWTNYTPLVHGTTYSNYCPVLTGNGKPHEFFRLLSQ